MMKLTVKPGGALRGTAAVPGDKSLSHRAVLFAALAEGESRIDNFLVSGVTRVMLESLRALGVRWELEGESLKVEGRGLSGLQATGDPLNCGNSATTIRLLAGALAAAGIPAVLDGSPGLRRRPMGRIVEPLRRMGVPVEAGENGGAPLRLEARAPGHKLRGIAETLPVASAQVKSCLLLAALAADRPTTLREPGPSRDHTERMLSSMGVEIHSRVIEESTGSVYETCLTPPTQSLRPLHLSLPGDMSAAAFLLVAGTIAPGSMIRIPGVEVNPTRTGLVDALRGMGADIRYENETVQGGEPVADLVVRASALHGTEIGGPLVVRMIDEFSIFGMAAACADGLTVVRDAAELRLKESDRIHTLCEELRRLGVQAEEFPEGFSIVGKGGGQDCAVMGGAVEAHGDHRLAMALAVAGLAARAPVTVEGAEILAESFPDFVDTLRALGAELFTEGAQPMAVEEREE
jgi:3-phosphoshikimate 1-carboxyvinyltransferase